MYVLKYNGKYVTDFGYPEPDVTSDINKSAIWFTKNDIKANARENGFTIDKEYEIVKCGIYELKV